MTDTTKICTLIVDDEELARDRIQSLLEMQHDVDIVGVCRDGVTALETIERERPDLVFLDVQMPGMDGFEVVENLDKSTMPAIVFVTAHDGHAIRAFEIHALDFSSSRSIKRGSRKRSSAPAAKSARRRPPSSTRDSSRCSRSCARSANIRNA